ncbi:type VI lipase adapter Tla3 domain-containing protein, partial [Burkholderia cepacia]
AGAAPGESHAALAHGFNGASALLARKGPQAVLEVRGLGAVTGYETNQEIWAKIVQKADNHASYFSSNPEDYPDSEDARLDDMRVSITTSFKLGARHAVEYWPVPVIVWGPAKNAHNAYRAAMNIADSRQKAGLGVTLFLWQEDANGDDGAAMLEKLFDFFDAHPDVPAALVYSLDGSTMRSLLGAPGSGGAAP